MPDIGKTLAKGPRIFVVIPLVALVVGAVGWVNWNHRQTIEGARNFAIIYKPPVGWKSEPHGPQTLFLYRNPVDHLLLRGSVNQIISEVNPTPELDTDGIAHFYIDRTHDNMKDWSATELKDVPAQGMQFNVIRRAKKNRTVVTAFAVRGNTTLLVSISGSDKHAGDVDSHIQGFYDYLSTLGMKMQDMSNL